MITALEIIVVILATAHHRCRRGTEEQDPGHGRRFRRRCRRLVREPGPSGMDAPAFQTDYRPVDSICHLYIAVRQTDAYFLNEFLGAVAYAAAPFLILC